MCNKINKNKILAESVPLNKKPRKYPNCVNYREEKCEWMKSITWEAGKIFIYSHYFITITYHYQKIKKNSLTHQ